VSLAFIASSKLPTEWGEFRLHVFSDSDTGKEHLALVYGDPAAQQPALCRVHSECLTGDALGSLRCDCGSQLKEAMRRIAANGSGLILYLRQEGRDIGLGNKIRAYALQDQGVDTVQANTDLGFAADARSYHMCKPMLDQLGISSLQLMTNNPRKVDALTALGIKVEERLPLLTGENPHNRHYLSTKRDKLGHIR
jgi:GTP cyclohydrolase II